MSWPAFQPRARTEKLCSPSLMFRLRTGVGEADSAAATGNTANAAPAETADRRKARRVVRELIEFMCRCGVADFLRLCQLEWARLLRETDSTGPFRGLVEFSPGFAPRPGISHVLFDFDGTLSLIREGWVEVMMAMFVELLPRRPGESAAAVQQVLRDDIMRQNGKQTIYQMIQFAERVKERGGEARE